MSVHPRPFTHSMSNHQQVQIACSPLVKKFLAKNYGIEPFMVGYKQNNPYAAYLATCLDRTPRPHKDFKMSHAMTETLTLGISGWRGKAGYGRELSPVTVREFNTFVRQNFLDRIVTELVMAQIHGRSVTSSITKILKRYDLKEEELSFDTVLRYYTRKRESYLDTFRD